MGLAVRFFGGRERVLEVADFTLSAVARDEFDRGVAAARASLSGEGFDQAWEEGRAMAAPERADLPIRRRGSGTAAGDRHARAARSRNQAALRIGDVALCQPDRPPALDEPADRGELAAPDGAQVVDLR